MPTWIDAETASAVTGATLDDAALTRAEDMVGTFAGKVPGDALRARDAHWLGRAVAYQAAWLATQPGLHTRADVSSISEDGISATFTEDGQVLAPMARRALSRCSWNGTRTVRLDAGARPDLDDDEKWSPLA